MQPTTYLVFGDLHGRILPAFRMASVWAREHGEPVAGLLQVGDLGYFPDVSRLDRATLKHAATDDLELGAALVASPSEEADQVFADPLVAEALWFTAGNHEDFDELQAMAHGMCAMPDEYPVDAYQRVRAIRDGHVAELPGGLRAGVLWGIDDLAPRARKGTAPEGCIKARSAAALEHRAFDVLLTHDGPRDAVLEGAGSDRIDAVLRGARPKLAFFGHYKVDGPAPIAWRGETRVYHLNGLEFRRSRRAEERCMGVLRWRGDAGEFAYVDAAWLGSWTRQNWRTR